MLGIGRRVVGAAVLCAALAVAVRAAAPLPALAAGATTIRVSVASDGTQANNNSFGTDVSGDGRYVVFSSRATNLGANYGYVGVYVHDTVTGSTELASVNDAGDPNIGTAGSDGDVSISRDGRYVAFDSAATNLVSGDDNGWIDVFVHDRQTGSTILLSRSAGGSGAPANANSEQPEISADGRHVVFVSNATDISPDATDGHYHVYVADLDSGTVSLVDRASDGTVAAGNSGATEPAINADGSVIAFDSDAQNLVPGDDGGTPGYQLDVFVRNRTTGTTTLASDPNLGPQALYTYEYPAISGDGSIVAFGGSDAWELDLSTGSIVKIPTQGTLAGGRMSDDGRYYVQLEQRTPSSSLSSFSYDPWVYDRVTGTRVNVGLTESGTVADAGTYLADGGRPSISDDGGVVAFSSDGTDLVAGDTNGKTDVFVRAQGSTGGDTEGPAVTAANAAPATPVVGDDVTITATVDDTGHGGSAIASAEMSVDSGPWQSLDAADGTFDAPTEQVSGLIAAPALGDHQACVRGTDEYANVGPQSCVTFSVAASLPPATIALTERITVSDAVSVNPPVEISLSEDIAVNDSAAVTPSVEISIGETVAVADDVTATALAPASPYGATTYDGFSTDTVLPGMDVEFSGSGFLPGTTVDLSLQSALIPLGTTTAASDGTFDVTVTIPAFAPLGDHHLVAAGTGYDGQPFVVTAPVTIVESGGRVQANGSVDPNVSSFAVSVHSHKGELYGNVVADIGPHELNADSLEWLVDAGGTALLHGSATLDDAPGYTFTLLLREQFAGPELFGLLVEDEAGDVVYDIGPAPVSAKQRTS